MVPILASSSESRNDAHHVLARKVGDTWGVTQLLSDPVLRVSPRLWSLGSGDLTSQSSSVMQQLAIMAGSPPQKGHQSSLCLIREMPAEVFDMNREHYRVVKRKLGMESLDMARRFSPEIADDAEIITGISPMFNAPFA